MLAAAHYTLGLTSMTQGKHADAAKSFATALRLDPNLIDAWINLGLARYRSDDMDAATAAMRRALALDPFHRAATANLAVFLRLTGELEAAETILGRLLAHDPDAAAARINLASNRLLDGRPREALALLDERPLPQQDRLRRQWLTQRALALIELGRPIEARAALALTSGSPSQLEPLIAWRQVLLAVSEGDREAAKAEAVKMEASLADRSRLLPEHLIMAHFDLAKFWNSAGDRDRAFSHWHEGHRVLGRLQPFSRETHRAWVDGMMARFDRVRMQSGPRAGNRDPAPVFIVGMPRSGTTLCEQIIAAHPQAFGAGERGALHHAFFALGRETAEGADRIAGLDAASLDGVADRYLAELHALAPGKARIVDKMPGNFNYLGLVGLMLPGARIIHCTRDPRDIGLSIFTFRFYGYHAYAHDLGDLGWYIAEHERLMAHWREALPNPILTVALKDWVEDFDGTLRRVLAFLDLPYDPACERFYENQGRVRTVSRDQVRRPVNATGLGRWRAYERHLQPLIAELEKNGVALPGETRQAANR